MLSRCYFDVGPTLSQHHINVFSLFNSVLYHTKQEISQSYAVEIVLYKQRDPRVFQFEIIINLLMS